MADLPDRRLRWATGTLPGRKPPNCTRRLGSASRSLTLASRSVAGTTTRYSRLRPAAEVSVTCIDIALHGPYCASVGRFWEKTFRPAGAGGGARTPTPVVTVTQDPLT